MMNNNRIKVFLLISLLLLAASVFAETSSKKVIKTIAVIPKGTTHEFWKSIHAGAIKAANELNIDIVWKGPQKEDDREQQVLVVEDFISWKVDGIVLAPLDDKALVLPVKQAVKRGIPVVIIDSDLKSDDYVSFVATDNYKGGQLAAQRLSSLLECHGKVIMLRYQEGSASTTNRENGFLDTMKKEFPEIELISTNQYGGATTESAYQKSENLFNTYKQIDGIFCPNESTTFGMLRALQDAKLSGQIKFVGFDSSAKLIEALRSGELHGLILQNPFKMGELGIKTLVDYFNGVKVSKRIDTGVTLVTKENMDEENIKELLQTDLSKYLNE